MVGNDHFRRYCSGQSAARPGRSARTARTSVRPAVTPRASHHGPVRSSQRPFRSKIDWGDLRLLLAYVAFFGALLVMPLWSGIVLRESNGGWAGLVAVIVGL